MSRAELKTFLSVSVATSIVLSVACIVLASRCVGLFNELSNEREANTHLDNALRRERLNNALMRIDVEHIARTAGVPIPPPHPIP